MDAYVFIPSDLEAGKILGSAIYRPNLVAVDGNYDDVNRLCARSATSTTGRSSTSTCAPTTPRAARRLGYEVAEQLGWRAPDHCVVPVASGSLFTKIYKGFE